MDSNDDAKLKDTMEPMGKEQLTTRLSEISRKSIDESRQQGRTTTITKRRFGKDILKQTDEENNESLNEIFISLNLTKFSDKSLMKRLKIKLADGNENPEEIFMSGSGDQYLHNLVNIMSTSGHEYQLLAVEILANLSPLSEKSGLKFARAAGPYLITLLSSPSNALKEASSVALGNLALSGYKVVKVLSHQDVINRLCFNLSDTPSDILNKNTAKNLSAEDSSCSKVESATLYALYHIIHSLDCSKLSNDGASSGLFPDDCLKELVKRCSTILSCKKTKSPLELFWVLFALSCHSDTHQFLADEEIIHTLLDICTYEIYQKSDPRPLVKVVTPICRLLANLCASQNSGEAACLFVLRHPDVTALLMALLGTNYIHLCKETLWLFANIVNSESVLVQEEIVELNVMDKLEYHTSAVIQKIDPYAVH